MEEWLKEREGNRWTDFPDYARRAQDINEGLEKEKRDKENRIKRAKKEKDTWKLLRLCIEFLKERCPMCKESEEKRRKLEEKERSRQERKRKTDMEKMTFKCGYVQKTINTFLKKLPEN